jgi:hypothetical protein
MKMEQAECSESLALKLLTPWNNPLRKHAAFKPRPKFEIKKHQTVSFQTPNESNKYLFLFKE